jgi:hypothetical protein
LGAISVTGSPREPDRNRRPRRDGDPRAGGRDAGVPRRSAGVGGVLAVAALIVVRLLSSSASTVPAPPRVPARPVVPAASSVAAFNRETYRFSTAWPLAQEARRYQVIVLSDTNAAEVPVLHALNPQLKILVYQSVMHTNMNDPAELPTTAGCTGYSADLADHRDWFLHDQNGVIVHSRSSSDHFLMDVGNPAYQQACAANAAALARRFGFDGVFFDAVSGILSWSMDPGTRVPRYPSSATWAAAMSALVAHLGAAMRARGLIAVGNIAGAPSAVVWEQWAGDLGGAEEESWTDGGLGPVQQIPYWSEKLTELAWTQAHDVYELLHSYALTEAANTYGLASMLLAARGTASYSTSNARTYTSQESWFPEYAAAQRLGAPSGPEETLALGVYERAFAHGIVLVNPGANPVHRFSLGGGAYSGSGLNDARSASLGPTSGLILLRVG